MMFLICSSASVGFHMVQNILGTVRWYQQRPRLCGFSKISIQSRYSYGICGPYKSDNYIYMIILYSPIAKVIYHNSVIRVKGYSGYNCT
jgi:hypothetical protein